MLWRGALVVAVLLAGNETFAQLPVLLCVEVFCKDGCVSGIQAATVT